MFEARMTEGGMLKKITEAMKDLVTEANFDCSTTGISLQAMDSSHVSLVALLLRADGFDHFRCDRNISLGINLSSMGKVLKCCNNDDIVTLKADDQADTMTFMFENQSADRISDFELKLMDIDSEHLGIPDTDYKSTVKMPAAEFQRICKDMAILGDTVTIAVGKDGVKFSVAGELGSGNMTIRSNTSVDTKEEDQVEVQFDEPVALNFALRYLNFFTKATPLSGTVLLSLSKDVPLVVEYRLEDLGHIRFYLAPKIEDEA
jgi:proliferating cell nuclear antigen